MLFLSLERSSSQPGAALYRDGKRLADCPAGRLPGMGQPSDTSPFSMAADCNRLLSTAGEGLSAILLTIGPGSFSGIRSAIGFAQGLALPNPGVRILGVSTAAVIAWQHLRLATSGASCVVMGDARREHVWKARFERNETGITGSEITLHPYASLADFGLQTPDVVLSPDAERLSTLSRQSSAFIPAHPTAEGLGSLYFAEPSMFVENPLPIYLHNAV